MYDIFSLPDFNMPEGFLWGSATAGHQIEGNNIHSQWWHKEQRDSSLSKSGKACNHYELYKEDVQLISDLGHQAYRLSLEWSRFEPVMGQWDSSVEKHYIELLSSLKEQGIKTFVTLLHGTYPQWFEELEAFAKYDNLKYFENYVQKVVPLISDYVDGWCILNENISSALGYGDLNFNFIKAHARGYHIIKQYSTAPVSTAHAFVQRYPNRMYDEFDNIMAKLTDLRANGFLLHAIRTGELVYPYKDAEYIQEVKDTVDFWAVNIYTRSLIDSRKKDLKADRFKHKKLKMINMEFYLDEMYPEGTTATLERLKDKPVYITENGCSCNDDRFRIIYIALYLSAIKDAIDRGVDIRGYFYWSLMDNYEWGSFLPRFGLVDVDFGAFTRTPKPSAAFYRDIIQNNGFNQEILRHYLKQVPSICDLNDLNDLL
jgi:beta-glucosidase